MFARTVVLIVTALPALGGAELSQASGDSARAPSTPADIARLLVDQGGVVDVPAKGKVKAPIKKGAPTFALPGGPSTVALLRLPTYQAPYRLTVKSSRRGIGRTTEIYFPSGVYFDAEFQQLGEFGEDRQGPPYVVEGKEGSLENVRVVIPFGEANKSARYVLLFTRGDLVGEPVSVEGDVVSRAVLGAFRAKVERSLEGNVEIETRLDPKQN